MLSPVITGTLFGTRALAGLLAGALVSGVQMAVSMSNTGGAWDNAKKYIEVGCNSLCGRVQRVGVGAEGVQMAVSMSNTGGAWNNAKKYIEVGWCDTAAAACLFLWGGERWVSVEVFGGTAANPQHGWLVLGAACVHTQGIETSKACRHGKR